MLKPKKTFAAPRGGSETGPGRGLGNSTARNTGGIEGSGSKNVSKVNQNGSAAPAKKMTGAEIRAHNDLITSMNARARKQIDAGLKKLK